jgi:hypothetical protein
LLPNILNIVSRHVRVHEASFLFIIIIFFFVV